MNKKGFLLVEVTLTIALVTLIGTIAIPASLAFFTERKFEEQSDAITHAVRTARDQSITGKDGATFGVAFFTDRYVLFQGTTYTARIAAKDITRPLPSGISVHTSLASLNEITFTNTGGITTNTSATIEITKNNLLRKAVFNKYGAETVWPVLDTANPPDEAVGTLEAYWKLDEASGKRYDSVGMYDLVKRDMELASGVGKINKGGQLGNYGQMRNIDGVLGNANRDFTVAGWFNVLSSTEAYLISGIVDQTDSLTWGIHYSAITNRFEFFSGDTAVTANTLGAPALNTWYFIAASYNATTKQLSIRANNGPADTTTLYGMPRNGTGVLIGGAGSARVDEIGIWEKVLTDTELTSLYNNGAGTTSPFSGTLGVKTGAFAPSTPTDLPAVDCGWLHTSKVLYPLYAENATTTSLAAWSSSTAALVKDDIGALVINKTSTSTITRTLQFRNFKDASSTPPDYYTTPPYGTDKIVVDVYGMGGLSAQDYTARIVHGPTSTINLATGTNMTRAKTIRYQGKTTGDWWGWKFLFSNADADALARNDTSFGFDFEAKLSGPSSTLAIDGVKMTACIPLHIDCFGDPECLMIDGSQGPKIPLQGTNDASIGGMAWGSPGYVIGSDDAYAGAGISMTATNYLRATGFSFTIPSSAVIKGVAVEWEKSTMPQPPPMPGGMGGMPSMSYSPVGDNSVRLVKGGSIAGTDKAKPDAWGTSDAFISYGSPTDMWGLTLTPSDVNSPMGALTDMNFGAVLSAKRLSGTNMGPAKVDSVRMTIYYKYLGGGASLYDMTIDYLKNLF